MGDQKIYCWDMALLSETYLSIMSEKMKPYGMERYFVPFMHLYKHSGAITQKDLCCVLKRDKVSIMRIVDYLSDIGLLKRKQDPNDRRCQILEITPKAHAMVPRIEQAAEETNDLLFKDFTSEERADFKRGMEKLMKQIDQLPDSDFIIHATKRTKK